MKEGRKERKKEQRKGGRKEGKKEREETTKEKILGWLRISWSSTDAGLKARGRGCFGDFHTSTFRYVMLLSVRIMCKC